MTSGTDLGTVYIFKSALLYRKIFTIENVTVKYFDNFLPVGYIPDSPNKKSMLNNK